eukprot:c2446_g1_i1.p1 GENE.c2446_g1_i1~~c2446_g1_i1.p1  ORF type:complete len:208 (-),score=46.81 c2446_g1_i1:11-634(-)
MVFYFECVDERFILFMGRDKEENEELIKWGWPEDIWFHVSSLSSAHVYLRMPRGMEMKDIPNEVIQEACQLVKANSIEGCKKDDVNVVYTPWGNLRKTAGMDVGQVGFKSEKDVVTVHKVEKNNDILRKLKKSKREAEPNLPEEKQQRDDSEKQIKRKIAEEERRREKAELNKRKEEARERSYDLILVPELMTSNKDVKEDDDDSFM